MDILGVHHELWRQHHSSAVKPEWGSTTVSPGSFGATFTPSQWNSIIHTGTLECAITSDDVDLYSNPANSLNSVDAIVKAECQIYCDLVMGEELPAYCDAVSNYCTCDTTIAGPIPVAPPTSCEDDDDCGEDDTRRSGSHSADSYGFACRSEGVAMSRLAALLLLLAGCSSGSVSATQGGSTTEDVGSCLLPSGH